MKLLNIFTTFVFLGRRL